MTLPDRPQSRASQGVTPLSARVMLAGMPKSGKTTLASGWAPDTTLIIDTHKGTTLLDGEHYVAHVDDWHGFEEVVDALVAGGHRYKTVVLDLVDDLWRFVDIANAGRNAVLASATEDYNRSAKTAEGVFHREIGRLLATDLGMWFLSHTETVQDGKVTRYVPKVDKRVRTFVQGVCQFVLLAETLGARRVIHTAPSAKFEAGSRVPLPEPMDLDARGLYAAMAKGLKAGTPTSQNSTPQTTEKVAA